MITSLRLHLLLKSDTTFGRGDGSPGEVDAEVQHDDLGLPFFGGRALKGILAQECADILFALGQSEKGRWYEAASKLFGQSGSSYQEAGSLSVGDARLPDELIGAARYAVELTESRSRLHPRQLLYSLTAIRAQTANSVETGAPLDESLRAMRVVLRETEFVSRLEFRLLPCDDELVLLAACVSALRRLGMGRNRGRGEIEMWLSDEQGSCLSGLLDNFIKEITSQ